MPLLVLYFFIITAVPTQISMALEVVVYLSERTYLYLYDTRIRTCTYIHIRAEYPPLSDAYVGLLNTYEDAGRGKAHVLYRVGWSLYMHITVTWTNGSDHIPRGSASHHSNSGAGLYRNSGRTVVI